MSTNVPRYSYRQVLRRTGRNAKKLETSSSDDSQKLAKRYLKFLAICNDPKASAAVLRRAPDSVIKRICDAALNAAANADIAIDDQQKRKFQRRRKLFSLLINPRIPIARKRRQLASQTGGAAAILPILLSTVLSTIGPLLFEKLISKE